MKKIISSIVLVVLIGTGVLFTFKDSDKNLTKIKVAEVTHSIFYAPQYIAHSLGYFEDEGLDVELILVPGADKVAAAVLSNDVNIGFCGSEASIYIYNEGETDYLVNFAGLTKRDGSFIVSREKIENFKLTDLIGKDVIGGRKGGMPEMTFEWGLKKNGIDPKTDVNIDTSIAFAAMAGSFIGGNGDFVTLFEPLALQIEKQGYGYVVESVGVIGGVVPYTAYNARKSYIENNPKIIEGFTKAIQRGLDYVHNNTAEEIAKNIVDYFPDTSINDVTKVVNRYKGIDSWYTTTEIMEADFNHVQTIMESAGELNKKAPYNKLVDTSFTIKNNE
ncbi:MAG: ABC transporter substrate-binding protein [Bacilli bacterium]|nr:ABC transporter substrate-binding protein [Bacilli bacterium]MDD4282175.1 ABC transporter substrate-binding protein [Bacilli bacterium]